MYACASHTHTPPVDTFAGAVAVVESSEVLSDSAPDLAAELITTVAGYRDDSCCAAGAFARWLCSAAWRTRQAV